jgi:hypothetical protein
MDQIDFAELKKAAQVMNDAMVAEGVPLIEKKLKTTAIKKEDLVRDFAQAVNDIPDDKIDKLPDSAYQVYQSLFTEADAAAATEGAAPADAAETAAEAAAAAAPAEGEKKKGKKEKKAKEPKEKKERKPPTPPVKEKNKYGHVINTQASKIDECLEKGGTLEELGKASETNSGRVLRHIKHLKNDKKVTIEETVTKVGEGDAAKEIKSYKIAQPAA